jgi:hypothetical protein
LVVFPEKGFEERVEAYANNVRELKFMLSGTMKTFAPDMPEILEMLVLLCECAEVPVFELPRAGLLLKAFPPRHSPPTSCGLGQTQERPSSTFRRPQLQP